MRRTSPLRRSSRVRSPSTRIRPSRLRTPTISTTWIRSATTPATGIRTWRRTRLLRAPSTLPRIRPARLSSSASRTTAARPAATARITTRPAATALVSASTRSTLPRSCRAVLSHGTKRHRQTAQHDPAKYLYQRTLHRDLPKSSRQPRQPKPIHLKTQTIPVPQLAATPETAESRRLLRPPPRRTRLHAAMSPHPKRTRASPPLQRRPSATLLIPPLVTLRLH
ncbi:MAG: hypothetical protein JWM43_2290 [Acidobacteriaceae bacterium]|nr:hypothetical protein [Acidobacteriaceae bacterium]